MLEALMESWVGKHILVIGDLCDDEWYEVSRKDSEECFAVRINERSRRVTQGMAGLVRQTVRGLGGFATLITRTEVAKRTRLVRNTGEVIGRLDVDCVAPPSDEEVQRIRHAARQVITGGGTAAVIISDYAQGTCDASVLREVMLTARENGIPVVVDPHRDTEWSKYEGCTIFKPNHREYRRGQRIHVLDWRARGIAPTVLVTKGAYGCDVILPGSEVEEFKGHHVPNADPLGCGDCVAAGLALTLAAGGYEVARDAALLASVANAVGAAAAAQKGIPRVEQRHVAGFLNRSIPGPEPMTAADRLPPSSS